MNFEHFQSIWSAQSPAPSVRDLDFAKLIRGHAPEISRRRRFLGYTIFVITLSLVILPLLTVANYRYKLPPNPAWYWTYSAVWMLIQTAFLVATLRAFERHGAIREQSTRSLRDLALATLASVEAEMRDCRIALRLTPPLVLFQIADLFVNFQPSHATSSSFLGRAAFVIGLPLVMGLVYWRHYRTNLVPVRERQQALLRELS